MCGFDSYSTTFELFVFWHARADVVACLCLCVCGVVSGRFQKCMKDWVCYIVLSCDFCKRKRLRSAFPEDAGGQSEVDQSFLFVLILSKKQQHRQFIQSFFFVSLLHARYIQLQTTSTERIDFCFLLNSENECTWCDGWVLFLFYHFVLFWILLCFLSKPVYLFYIQVWYSRTKTILHTNTTRFVRALDLLLVIIYIIVCF